MDCKVQKKDKGHGRDGSSQHKTYTGSQMRMPLHHLLTYQIKKDPLPEGISWASPIPSQNRVPTSLRICIIQFRFLNGGHLYFLSSHLPGLA